MAADSTSLSPEEAVARLLARLPKPARLLVAISGGSDSTGLLVALSRARPDDVSLFAATVDHRLRCESAAEAQQVAAMCRVLDIPHVVKAWEGEKPGSGIAAAARENRYRLLCEAAQDVGADAILTGHTLDDQIETVTMRSVRNDDPDLPGLAGMADAVLLHRRHWLLRPFLSTRRSAIRELLQHLGHGWIDDPSNVDRRSERARTRLDSAAQTMSPLEVKTAAERRSGLSEAAALLFSRHVAVHHAVLMHVSPGAFDADPAVLRYLLSVLAAVLGGRAQGPSADSLDRVMASCLRGAPGRMTTGRVVFDLRKTGLFLCREARGLRPLPLAAGETAIWDGRFRVTNSGSAAAVLERCAADRDGAMQRFPDIPASVAIRAICAMPAYGLSGGQVDGVSWQPVLAPFDRFLPQFDYTLAASLAERFGCDGFAPMPFGDSVRKR